MKIRYMLKLKINFLFCALLLLSCLSCDLGVHQAFWRPHPVYSRSTEVVQLNNTEFPFSREIMPLKYDCLILTDIHFGNKRNPAWDKVFFDSLKKYRKGRISPMLFCIILGDIADHGFASEYETVKAFQKRIAEENRLPEEYGNRPMPVYHVVGNHDVYNSGWKLWQQTCYPHKSAYYFETKDLEWYFVDTASGTLGRPQFYDLKAKLQRSPKSKFIFTHYPLYGNGILYFSLSDPRERAELLSLFSQVNLKLYCSGHFHPGASCDYDTFKERSLQAFGVSGKYHILHVDESGEEPSFTIETISLL
ncbi:MAG: metallophosphoesterase family protein [Treponema sp.]|uniref:metallophosphoesterase family protein n=2 Tax=Treponema sp. TaxID=166 RepID=UPI003FA2D152